MATINFQNPLNVSCQVGDEVYYTLTSNSSGFTTSTTGNSIILVGTITSITVGATQTSIFIQNGLLPPQGSNPYFMFRKARSHNTDGVKGYYAETKMVNSDSKNNKVELYAVSSEVDESSK